VGSTAYTDFAEKEKAAKAIKGMVVERRTKRYDLAGS
jgi:hypothetical protein